MTEMITESISQLLLWTQWPGPCWLGIQAHRVWPVAPHPQPASTGDPKRGRGAGAVVTQALLPIPSAPYPTLGRCGVMDPDSAQPWGGGPPGVTLDTCEGLRKGHSRKHCPGVSPYPETMAGTQPSPHPRDLRVLGQSSTGSIPVGSQACSPRSGHATRELASADPVLGRVVRGALLGMWACQRGIAWARCSLEPGPSYGGGFTAPCAPGHLLHRG